MIDRSASNTVVTCYLLNRRILRTTGEFKSELNHFLTWLVHSRPFEYGMKEIEPIPVGYSRFQQDIADRVPDTSKAPNEPAKK